MRKQKVLFLCTQNSARSQMAEGFLRHLAGDRFEVCSAGIEPTDEIHPYAVEAMSEVGTDISGQYPEGLRTYLGKMGFNYLIIVCARAEERCPKTFPGVGTTFSRVFEDPRRDEKIPYDSMLERFRSVRDEIELKIRDWLEHPEEELKKLREERERERRERLTASRWGGAEPPSRQWGKGGVARGHSHRPQPRPHGQGDSRLPQHVAAYRRAPCSPSAFTGRSESPRRGDSRRLPEGFS
jgi:arsenate reductase (thioredoxin)